MNGGSIMRWITLVALFIASPVFAQIPPNSIVTPEPREVPLPQQERFLTFDPNTAQVKLIDSRWQLWASDVIVKDFGPAQADAQDALRAVRELQFTHYSAIGSDRPVMEYWLSSGKAPHPGSFRRTMRPFDPPTLKVANYNGAWVLRDKSQILFHFGPNRSDAEQALGVCQKYGFNQVVYVGHPAPSMTYFVFDRMQGPGTVKEPSTYEALRDAELLARSALTITGIGYVGERMPIEVRKLEVRQENKEWVVAHSRVILGKFGPNETEARAALRVLQDWRVTEWCRVGTAGVEFFLVNGRPPHGLSLSVRSTSIDPKLIAVKDVGGSWTISDGRRNLFDFGSDSDQAQLVLKVMKHFQFDQLATMGHPLRPGMKFLAKSR